MSPWLIWIKYFESKLCTCFLDDVDDDANDEDDNDNDEDDDVEEEGDNREALTGQGEDDKTLKDFFSLEETPSIRSSADCCSTLD